MDLLTKILYFLLAIVVLASIGVSIPFLLDYTNDNPNKLINLNKNLITYYVAIFVTSSLDIIIKKFDDYGSSRKPIFLGITLFNIVVLSISGILISKEYDGFSYIILFFVVVAYIMWWASNVNNPNLRASSSIGGDPNKELKNG